MPNFLDTLAQSRTSELPKSPVLLFGNGSNLQNTKGIHSRTKRKIITQKMILSLVDLAKKKGNQEKVKQFWNTYHCMGKIYTADGRLFGDYCKNRICTLCNSIRKANLINKYLPIIESWEDPQFLTLTIKAAPAKKLKYLVDGMLKAFQQIKDTQRKRYSRGKGMKLIGIKSLECNFNPKTRTYNPHFHMILPSKEIAVLIRKEWLNKWQWKSPLTADGKKRKRYVVPCAQKICPVTDGKTSLMEIIKYGSKIFTEPDINKKRKPNSSHYIYVAALYNILESMQGHRLFDRFGFDEPVRKERQEITPNLISHYDLWIFEHRQINWVNTENGKLLTEYQACDDLLILLNDNINTQLE